MRTKGWSALGALMALAAAAAEDTPGRNALPPVNDGSATESTGVWSHRHVPDLAATADAKVGRAALVGTFGFTHHIILAAGKGRSWNLTGYGKLRFWVKADRANDSLLVMLLTRGRAPAWRPSSCALCLRRAPTTRRAWSTSTRSVS